MNEEKKEAPKLTVKSVKDNMLPTGVLALDVTPDAKNAFASCIDGGVYAVDLGNGENHKLGGHDSYASGVALIANSPLLVSAGYDGVLQWHDTVERKTIRKVSAHKFWSWQSRVSPDGGERERDRGPADARLHQWSIGRRVRDVQQVQFGAQHAADDRSRPPGDAAGREGQRG